MKELLRMVFADGRSSIGQISVDDLPKYQCRYSGIDYKIEHDGYLTTIREYAPEIAAASPFFPEHLLDAPCIAKVESSGNVYCSGRVIVGFYAPDSTSTRRPAFMSVNDNPTYGPLGLRLVQSA